MSIISDVTGYIKDTFRGSSKAVAIAKVTGRSDNYTPQITISPGFEINPADGEKLIIQKINGSSSYMVAIAGTNQNIEPDTDRGERRIFSVSENGETIKSIAKFKNDGTLELNGATDSAVKFADLKAGFDTLKSDFNAFLLHVHGASGTPPVPPATPSTASVDAAESSDIKIS